MVTTLQDTQKTVQRSLNKQLEKPNKFTQSAVGFVLGRSGSNRINKNQSAASLAAKAIENGKVSRAFISIQEKQAMYLEPSLEGQTLTKDINNDGGLFNLPKTKGRFVGKGLVPKYNRAGNITGLKSGKVKKFRRKALGGDKTFFTVKKDTGRLKAGVYARIQGSRRKKPGLARVLAQNKRQTFKKLNFNFEAETVAALNTHFDRNLDRELDKAMRNQGF